MKKLICLLVLCISSVCQAQGSSILPYITQYWRSVIDGPSELINIEDLTISQAKTPVIRSSTYDVKFEGAGWLYVVGKYCYMTAYESDTLNIIDISDPDSPVIISQLTDSTNLEGCEGITVIGNYAYITCTEAHRFIVVDISDPTNPSIIGNLHDAVQLNGVEGMDIVGKYAFCVCWYGDAVTVVDISDPTNPVVIDTLTDVATLRNPIYLKVRGNYAYVSCRGSVIANTTGGLTILDVSDPTNISYVNRIGYDDDNLINYPAGLDVDGSYVYLAGTKANTLLIIDVSDPANLSVTGSLTDNTNLADILIGEKSGNHYYTSSHASHSFSIINVSDPTTPVLSTVVIDGYDLGSPDDFMIQGKYA